jgi:hypothetical protein
MSPVEITVIVALVLVIAGILLACYAAEGIELDEP